METCTEWFSLYFFKTHLRIFVLTMVTNGKRVISLKTIYILNVPMATTTNKIIKGMYRDQKFLNTLKKRAVKKLIKKMYLMVYKQIHGKTMSEV